MVDEKVSVHRHNANILWRALPVVVLEQLLLKHAGRHVVRVADLKLARVIQDVASAHLARAGFEQAFGARSLKRIIQGEIAARASILRLDGTVGEGGTIDVQAGAAADADSADGGSPALSVVAR